MKTAINKRTLTTLALMAICSVGFTQIQVATTPKDTAIQFKLLGNVDNEPLFGLTLNNSEKEGYVISVRDEDNEVLFTEILNGDKLSRKYKLDINEDEVDYSRFRVTFEITSRKTNKTTVYNITKTHREVEDILVAKL